MWGNVQKRGAGLICKEMLKPATRLNDCGSFAWSVQQPVRNFKKRANRKVPIPKQPYKEHTGDMEGYDRFKPGKLISTGEKIHGVSRNFQANVIDPEEKDDGEIGYRSYLGEKSPLPVRNAVPFGEWTPFSVRAGAVGRKLGMMGVWDNYGRYRACTVVQIQGCEICEVKKRLTGRRLDIPQVYLQIGAGDVNLRQVRKTKLCHFRKLGVKPKKKVYDFKITPDAILPTGTPIVARHFVPGQFLDITSVSRGKGFAGTIKRHGFSRQPESHGNSKTTRAVGSTGQCQDPGKVFKGKKMPGHMGKNQTYTRNTLLYKIDVDRNLLFIHAHIPGPQGSMCVLRDAVGAQWAPENPPPFPTYLPEEGEEQVNEIVMDVTHKKDPMLMYEA